MLSVGYDIGSSAIKCAILDCATGKTLCRGSHPAEEMPIQSPRPGWAEQDPGAWWEHLVTLTRRLVTESRLDVSSVGSVGISYQMHGLVLVDDRQRVLRPSIIWCDSRAVEIGRKAFETLGREYCLGSLLNSPGNFTASKLRWVRELEPDIFRRVHKAMLPGDFIAMKLTGEISTTLSGLSEGIFWDFKRNALSQEVLDYYEIDEQLLPEVCPTFSIQGRLTKRAAGELGLNDGIPISYRAGDQPNNALSLHVLRPGEVAATAGTSGVVYSVSDRIVHDPKSRVNPFAHVTHTADRPRLGILLCINGAGILNSWLRKNVAGGAPYDLLNVEAGRIPIGSDGLTVIPFGNGAERILENNNLGARIVGIDLNRHSRAHLVRAAQEGIAFSFRYGMDIMKEMGVETRVIRAGRANMFLSPVFRETIANCTGATIELFDTDGAEGAARGAASGAGLFASLDDAFASLRKIGEVCPSPDGAAAAKGSYERWLTHLTST